MDELELTAISPIDGRYKNKCSELSKYFSESALIYYRVFVEISWFKFLASTPAIKELPPLTEKTTQFLDNILNEPRNTMALEVKELEQTTKHDVKAAEYYLANKFMQNESLKPYISFIHFACTSEDINNVSYNLMCHEYCQDILHSSLTSLHSDINKFAKTTSTIAMLSRTHGQAASPTTVGKEMSVFANRMVKYIKQIHTTKLTSKFSGAVGNYNAHMVAYPDTDWPQLSKTFIESLGLEQNTHTTQIEPHDTLCTLLHTCHSINSITTDFAKDMWTYISLGYFTQKNNSKEVGSSTMPHKINPIDFENAEGNFGIANALSQYLTTKLPMSRLQRDLTDSTTLRNIGVCFAHMYLAINNLSFGLSKLEVNRNKINADLEHRWELLSEPIQTVMRKHGIADAYEQLKAISKGQEITKESLHSFIQTLKIPETDKALLLKLTPSSYIGAAADIATNTSPLKD